MARYNKTDVVIGDTVKSDVNVQLGLIETAITSSLSRDGDLPNSMNSDIDMNSNQILNLPDAVTSGEPITLRQGLSTLDFTLAIAEAKYYDTVVLATADTTLVSGDVVILKDRANAIFDIISGVSLANDWSVVAHDTLSISLQVRIDSEIQTVEDRTWYVDAALGTDALGNGVASGASAFKTIQYAYDSLPNIIKHQQTIQIADGTYNESTIASGDQPRPAILWGKGKITTFRSAVSGGEMTGAIVLKGNASDKTLVKIETTSAYTYGVYINKGNVGFQDLTIQSNGVNTASALLVAHRTDVYLHLNNVDIDGRSFATSGINIESSGQVEFGGGGVIRDCTNGVQTLTAGDTIVLSSSGSPVITGCTTGVLAKANSFVGLYSGQDGNGKVEVVDSTCTTGINALGGAQIDIRGQDATTDMAQIGSIITAESGVHINLVFGETLEVVTLKNSTIKYNASNYQRNILLYDSLIHLETSNSYVSPATASTDLRPIQLLNGSSAYQEGTNNINGSGGITVPTQFPTSLTFAANSEVKAAVYGRNDLKVSSAAGGPYTGCEIDSTDIEEGRIIAVTFNNDNTNNVELIGTGTHMLFTNNITLGKTAGHYTGVTLQMIDSKWRIIGLGQLIV